MEQTHQFISSDYGRILKGFQIKFDPQESHGLNIAFLTLLMSIFFGHFDIQVKGDYTRENVKHVLTELKFEKVSDFMERSDDWYRIDADLFIIAHYRNCTSELYQKNIDDLIDLNQDVDIDHLIEWVFRAYDTILENKKMHYQTFSAIYHYACAEETAAAEYAQITASSNDFSYDNLDVRHEVFVYSKHHGTMFYAYPDLCTERIPITVFDEYNDSKRFYYKAFNMKPRYESTYVNPF